MQLPTSNRLLDVLSPASRDQILAVSKHVVLPVRTTLVEAEQQQRYAYLMTAGIASVLIELAEGGTAEVTLIGREGMVGGLQLLGPALSPARSFIQMSGSAFRLPFADMRRIFLESEEVRSRVLEMVQQQSLTISQLAACNKLHETEARMARWLLMVRDRVDDDTVMLTQEFLAQMLGTQRTTVVMAAGALQRSGLIEYSRGKITILSRENLEEAACDCYRIVRQFHENLYRNV